MKRAVLRWSSPPLPKILLSLVEVPEGCQGSGRQRFPLGFIIQLVETYDDNLMLLQLASDASLSNEQAKTTRPHRRILETSEDSISVRKLSLQCGTPSGKRRHLAILNIFRSGMMILHRISNNLLLTSSPSL